MLTEASGLRRGSLEGNPGPAKRRRIDLIPHPTTTDSTNQFVSSSSEYTYAAEIREHSLEGSNYATNPDLDETDALSGECCFGMLSGFVVNIRHTSLDSGALPKDKHNVFFAENTNTLHSEARYGLSFDIPCPKAIRILADLQDVKEVSTQLFCYKKSEPDAWTNSGKRQKSSLPLVWLLDMILFGPSDLEYVIGSYLTGLQMYLQDPFGCKRHVVYRNPHIIPPESGDVVMADSFDTTATLAIETLEAVPDLLAQLLQDEIPLAETEPPSSVKTPLFSHQKIALTFMLQREKGWAMGEGSGDIWTKYYSNFGAVGFRNNVVGRSQVSSPPDFRGGLLADDMGLGKTLSMLTLIVANQFVTQSPILKRPFNAGRVKATLLIVPPPLIQSWEKQFSQHLHDGTLNICVFHGQNRKEVEALGKYDVVITTFHTVSAIWRKKGDPQSSQGSIFSVIWHRIVLDEAHTIQNSRSDLAQSCCALRSTNRWAITGTPIQNKLSDFQSLLAFLLVYPYCKQADFDEDISRPWQRGEKDGFLRLKTLVKAITISRTKAVVNLPTRKDEIHHLEFTPEERLAYETARARTVQTLQTANLSDDQSPTTFNALQHLNILRLICSHGLMAQVYHQTSTKNLSQLSTRQYEMDDDKSHSTCDQCGLDKLEELLEGATYNKFSASTTSGTNSRSLCANCASEIGISSVTDRNQFELECVSPPMYATAGLDDTKRMSTKIKALVRDISMHSLEEKSVVFSYWTYTLDLIQILLDMQEIPYTRMDGKTSLSKRKDALSEFETNTSLRVILVSITCGGAGLDLTSASRVYLMEPHWNPMVEEQALCRVHRVGQRREVTTIRYLIRDSFEEQVVEIQKRKKLLAQVTFGQGSLPEGGIGLGTLRYLKSVLE